MITLSKVEQGISFAFDNSSHYLFNGEIIVPVNSLSLVFDESDMATFYKANSNDIFISANIGEFGMTKAELEEWYASNMVAASEGLTPEEVEELIDDALLNYYDEDEIDTALSAKQNLLVSGQNIKTVNNESLLGSGNIDIQGGGSYEAGTNISITTGETADTINCTLPITAPTSSADSKSISIGYAISGGNSYYSILEGRNINANFTRQSVIISPNETNTFYTTNVNGEGSVVIGNSLTLTGSSRPVGVVIGNSCSVSGTQSTAIGIGSRVTGNCSVAIGRNANITSHNSVAIGNSALTSGDSSVAIGNNTQSDGVNYKTNLNNQIKITPTNQIYIYDKTNSEMIWLQDSIGGGGGTVDPSIDSGSTNPVENRAIYNKFDEVEQVTASALNVLNDKFGGLRLVKISQTDYENLLVKDNNTLYIVLED